MNALARLQRAFQRGIDRADTGFEREIEGSARLPAHARLDIYAGAYRLRLVEALGKDHPGLKALLGDEDFERAARAYVEAHPSRFANLRWYGGELAAFLRRAAPWRRRPAAAEMAAFEWAVGLAFDAADDPALEGGAVYGRAPEAWPGMRFRPHASARRLDLHFNVPALRAAADAGDPLPPLRRRRGPVPWLIWRRQLTVQFRSLERDEARMLDPLLRGETFGEACESLARTHGEAAALRAASLLKGWLGEGVFKESA